MSNRRVSVMAPSNIALVKYMGKLDAEINLPANASFSLTLNDLCTYVEISSSSTSETGASGVKWVSEVPEKAKGNPEAKPPTLSESGIARMTRHFERVRNLLPEVFTPYGLTVADPRAIEIRTANTFPSDSGIASSASSFAAVTLGTALLFANDSKKFMKLWESDLEFRRGLAMISRQGSGSSCRSFEGPWVMWGKEKAGSVFDGVKNPMPEMSDLVVLIGSAPKEVSSSQAHLLEKTSPLWHGRIERTTNRLSSGVQALKAGDLAKISKMAWDEMWEMHSMFHTCENPFTYFEPGTVEVLKWLSPQREAAKLIVTMDAGANVHVLIPTAEALALKAKLEKAFPKFKILLDTQGAGPKVLEA